MPRDESSVFDDRHRGFTPRAMVKAALTGHAKMRLKQRCTIQPGDLKQLLNSNKYLLLEAENFGTVAHKLFYSMADDAYFVAIQGTSTGAVITVLPAEWWSNGPPIGAKAKQLVKRLVVGVPRQEKQSHQLIQRDQERTRVRLSEKKLRRAVGIRTPAPQARNGELALPAPKVTANDYKFYATLANERGEQRVAYLARFDGWDLTDPIANRKAERLLRAQLRQVQNEGEVPITIHMQLGIEMFPVDELLSRLT